MGDEENKELKKKSEVFTLLNIKTYYQARVMKTMQCRHRDRNADRTRTQTSTYLVT